LCHPRERKPAAQFVGMGPFAGAANEHKTDPHLLCVGVAQLLHLRRENNGKGQIAASHTPGVATTTALDAEYRGISMHRLRLFLVAGGALLCLTSSTSQANPLSLGDWGLSQVNRQVVPSTIENSFDPASPEVYLGKAGDGWNVGSDPVGGEMLPIGGIKLPPQHHTVETVTVPVPEPSSLLLLTGGMGFGAMLLRRKRS
jgi:hypothetical protein